MKTLLFQPPIPPPRVEISIGTYPKALEARKQLAIFVDAAIAETHGKALQKVLGGELFPIEGGEKAKSRQMKEKIEDTLSKRQFGREALFIALGGGTLCDLVGFVASTYLRGVDLIFIPTTLLAMVDAAIGGKTGVNTPFGKNQIGSFYHPKAIFIDPTYLSTLPQKEWYNGLAEILKYGLIFDPSIWEFCEAHVADWQDPRLLEILITSSLKALIQIVERDPLEQTGFRRILNFGHTVAHALESACHYEIPHGQAVAIGCIAESFLSSHLGFLPSAAFKRIEHLYQQLKYPLEIPSPFRKQPFLDAMKWDKKTKEGQVRCVLIDCIGHALPFDGEYCTSIDPNPLAEWLTT